MAFAHPARFPFPANESEPYMTPEQLAYFREKLLDFRQGLNRKLLESTRALQRNDERANEIVDQAENDRFRNRLAEECIRCRRLLEANEAALIRIADGSYGYCAETGEEIGIPRLQAVPHAALCIHAQERLERGLAGRASRS